MVSVFGIFFLMSGSRAVISTMYILPPVMTQDCAVLRIDLRAPSNKEIVCDCTNVVADVARLCMGTSSRAGAKFLTRWKSCVIWVLQASILELLFIQYMLFYLQFIGVFTQCEYHMTWQRVSLDIDLIFVQTLGKGKVEIVCLWSNSVIFPCRSTTKRGTPRWNPVLTVIWELQSLAKYTEWRMNLEHDYHFNIQTAFGRGTWSCTKEMKNALTEMICQDTGAHAISVGVGGGRTRLAQLHGTYGIEDGTAH